MKLAPRPGPSPYDPDADKTRLDLRPWHDESGSYIVDEVDEANDADEVDTPRAPARSHVELARYRPQRPPSVLLEAMPLPAGLSEGMLPAGIRPSTANQLRIAIVRVTRELGREYRESYHRMLRTDAASVEVLQRHLLAAADAVLHGKKDPRTMAPMLARHGVVFGEILAHTIDARWTHLAGDNPGAWSMSLPSGLEVHPVARVHRFLLQRSREQDLVGFYLELVS